MKKYEQLSEEAKKKRLEYLREWRKKHPDKVKAYSVRYWNHKAETDTRQCESERGD